MSPSELNKVIRRSIFAMESANYASYDPFDALTSPILDLLSRPSVFLRRAVVQLNKKSAVNIRPLLGIKRAIHTKTVSDMLSIYSMLDNVTPGESVEGRRIKMQRMLLDKSIHLAGGLAWGLGFPYATRFVDAGSETPNLFNTINSVQSIMDYYDATKDDRMKEVVEGVVKFLYNHLGITAVGTDRGWFRYYPGQTVPNFNVNASTAAFFVRANLTFNAEVASWADIARLLNFLRDHQNEDGSWYYAASENGKWIDGFHTGYILESLAYISSVDVTFDVTDMLNRGADFYLSALFTPGGIPKFFHNNLYPIEAQNCAQAIQTLAKLEIYGNRKTRDMLIRVVDNTLDYLYDGDRGVFFFKKERHFTYRQVFLRWSQAPMILALVNAGHVLRGTK